MSYLAYQKHLAFSHPSLTAQVSDDDLTTERKSGPCGTLLMCTSYCSVILCAIACLVAAILVTVVIASEGTCKQYNDDKLLDQVYMIWNLKFRVTLFL